MPLSLDFLHSCYVSAFKELAPGRQIPSVKVSFYPYVNVNHTIRVRDGKVLVRISDLFTDAPESVQKALARILVAKILSLKVPKKPNDLYKQYVASPDFIKIAKKNKQTKGRKVVTSSKGKHYDLDAIFEKLNLVYFEKRLKKPVLTWSKKKTYRRLGHHDEAHNTIVISKSLDTFTVPKFVLEFVMYHEMLHMKHPVLYKNGRRYLHTSSFRKDEKDFFYFSEAETWIEKNASRFRKDSSSTRARNAAQRLLDLFD